MEKLHIFEGEFPIYRQLGLSNVSLQDIPYLELTLGFAFLIYVLEQYLNMRQLAMFLKSKDIPNELKEYISQETFEKSLVYGYDKLYFSSVEGTFVFLENWALVLLGYLPFAWDFSSSTLSRLGLTDVAYSPLFLEMCRTCFFLTILILHDTIISMPFSYYSTFVIEARHGFNRSTLPLFIQDKIKGFLLTVVFGCPILSTIVYLVRKGGSHFYFYVWAFLFVVSAVMMAIYPSVIAPLFNKYTPLEEGEIKQNIEQLAMRVSFPLTKVYVVDGSTRSAHSNAYFYGFLKNKRIVLYDTLIKQVTSGELMAILGHEIGHWKLWHTIEGFVIFHVSIFMMFLCFSYTQNAPNLYESFGFARSNGSLGVPVFVELMLFIQTFWTPVEKVLQLIVTFNSRKNEFAADKFSTDLGMGKELISGLMKLNIENLGNMVPDKYYAMYHFSHPHLIERVRAIETNSKKLE